MKLHLEDVFAEDERRTEKVAQQQPDILCGATEGKNDRRTTLRQIYLVLNLRQSVYS